MTISTKTANALAQALGPEGISEAAEITAVLNNPSIVSAQTGIVAKAGGGAAGTLLTTTINKVVTVATIGDSVLLPVSVNGQYVTVANFGANAMDVFPQAADTINALAAGVAVRLLPGGALDFFCPAAGGWVAEFFSVPAAQYSTSAVAGPTTALAGAMTGAATVVAEYTNIGANNLTTRTATQMFADMGNVKPGDSYLLMIRNVNAGQITVVAGAGVTLTGTATIAANTCRLYVVTFTSAIALVMQNVGGGIAV